MYYRPFPILLFSLIIFSCDEQKVPGCMEESKCNYDSKATEEDSSCGSGEYTCGDGTSGCGCDDVCDGSAVEDCAGTCNGTAVADCLGTCNGSAVVYDLPPTHCFNKSEVDFVFDLYNRPY